MNDGTPSRPLDSINATADRAQPGTRILIHEGVYRECVRPARGGDGPETMISNESDQSDQVVIKASEVVESFEPSTDYRLNRDHHWIIEDCTIDWSNGVGIDIGNQDWHYKMEDPGIVDGHAVYGEGTDHLRIAHNLLGLCRSSGYYAKAVPFRFERTGRGGTSRDAEIYNNIFYACGEAAIKFPTEKNVSDGNLFLNMPGGYLRILYPAPACLDLVAWQEYYGMDANSAEGELRISVDTESYQLTIQPARPQNLPKRWQRNEEGYVKEPRRSRRSVRTVWHPATFMERPGQAMRRCPVRSLSFGRELSWILTQE